LDIIIQRIDPDVVVVSLAQRQLITFIEKRFQFNLVDISRGHDHNNPEEPVVDPAFTLAIVPNSWFKISAGEQKLLESEWIKSKGITDLQEQSLTVFSKVKKSVDVCAIRAISAIDKYLAHEFAMNVTTDGQLITAGAETTIRQSQFSQLTRTTTEEIRIPDDIMPIIDVRYIDPGPVLSIDKHTFYSLGIFSHAKPNSTPQPVEVGCEIIPSLYEILNQCQSPQGKKTMKTVMMWPLQSIEEIHHRHEVVDYFMRPENKIFRDQVQAHLKQISPISGILAKLSQSVGGFKEFKILYKSMWAFIAISDLIQANSCNEVEILRRILSLDNPQFRSTVSQIVSTVDFEASKRVARIEVCPGVSDAVEHKRTVINDLAKFCQEVEIEETAKYKDILHKPCKVSYIPRIGFIESVHYNSLSELENIRMDKGFSFLLHTEESVYFKTKRMEELDQQVGDVSCDLIDLQEAVVIDMQNAILKQSETILRFSELCGELDCFVAFAEVSLQKGFMRPEFVASNDEIDIHDAFHPAQASRHTVVPNHIRFFKEGTERKARVMVITGPNSCGKTTYMKTACLVIYMAHMGCFVPASYARIPVVDAILTRLHSANSISTGLSTFATDLNQINHALARATPRSLLAIDEFGKGTQARDGFHLLKGLIAYFVVRGHASPHVMIATHFNRLIDHLQSYNEYILYKTFQVKKDTTNDSIVYEFKMIDGVCESSLADQVARTAGVPETIINRATQVRDYITGGRELQQRPPCGA